MRRLKCSDSDTPSCFKILYLGARNYSLQLVVVIKMSQLLQHFKCKCTQTQACSDLNIIP
jgi:hypothetical protein